MEKKFLPWFNSKLSKLRYRIVFVWGQLLSLAQKMSYFTLTVWLGKLFEYMYTRIVMDHVPKTWVNALKVSGFWKKSSNTIISKMLDINEEKPNSTCLLKHIFVCINSYFEYRICHYTKLLSASSCVYIIVESVSKKKFPDKSNRCYIFTFSFLVYVFIFFF